MLSCPQAGIDGLAIATWFSPAVLDELKLPGGAARAKLLADIQRLRGDVHDVTRRSNAHTRPPSAPNRRVTTGRPRHRARGKSMPKKTRDYDDRLTLAGLRRATAAASAPTVAAPIRSAITEAEVAQKQAEADEAQTELEAAHAALAKAKAKAAAAGLAELNTALAPEELAAAASDQTPKNLASSPIPTTGSPKQSSKSMAPHRRVVLFRSSSTGTFGVSFGLASNGDAIVTAVGDAASGQLAVEDRVAALNGHSVTKAMLEGLATAIASSEVLVVDLEGGGEANPNWSDVNAVRSAVSGLKLKPQVAIQPKPQPQIKPSPGKLGASELEAAALFAKDNGHFVAMESTSAGPAATTYRATGDEMNTTAVAPSSDVRLGSPSLVPRTKSGASRKEVEVVVRRSGPSLGIGIKGGSDVRSQFDGAPLAVTVHYIYPSSPAFGILLEGDQLLTIDGIEVSNLTHAEIEDVIRSAGDTIHFRVSRGEPVPDYSAFMRGGSAIFKPPPPPSTLPAASIDASDAPTVSSETSSAPLHTGNPVVALPSLGSEAQSMRPESVTSQGEYDNVEGAGNSGWALNGSSVGRFRDQSPIGAAPAEVITADVSNETSSELKSTVDETSSVIPELQSTVDPSWVSPTPNLSQINEALVEAGFSTFASRDEEYSAPLHNEPEPGSSGNFEAETTDSDARKEVDTNASEKTHVLKRSPDGSLGLMLEHHRNDPTPIGARILEVFEGGAAEKAGLITGSVVLSLGGRDVSNDSYKNVTNILRELVNDKEVEMLVKVPS